MTNAEKYLKDNVSVEEFAQKLHISMCSNPESDFSYKSAIITFLKEQVQPTLTEDERVILRNIDTRRYPTIKRTKIGEIIVISNAKCGDDIICYLYCYDHLFQFIKERRRILNRRITERRIKK